MKAVERAKERNPLAFVFLAFAAYAAVLGGFLSRLPDIQLRLELSNSELGMILLGVPIGIVGGSIFFSGFIERMGAKKASGMFTFLFCLCPVLSGMAGSGWALAIFLVVQGVMLSLANVSVNVLALQWEKAKSRRVLNRCHGIWSLTLLGASLTGAGMVGFGVDFRVQFACTFVLAAGLLLPAYVSDPMELSSAGSRPAPLVLPTRGVLQIVAYASATVMVEGITRNWGIIYLRDSLGATAQIAALGLPVVILSQAAGRLVADPLIEKHGVALVATSMIVVCAFGCLLLAGATGPWAGLAGILLIGLGVSVAHPQSVAASAAIGDRPASENVAAFSTIQTLLVYCAPSLFGLLSGTFGLRFAMLGMVPLVLSTLYFVPAIASRRSG